MAIYDIDVNGVVLNANVPLPAGVQTATKRRRVVAVGLSGGGAAADTKVEIFYNKTSMGEFDNTGTNDVCNKADLRYLPADFALGSKLPLTVKVTDAAPSACYLTLIIKSLPYSSRRY